MRAVKAGKELMQIVQSSAIEAGIFRLFAFQIHRSNFAEKTCRIPTVPPLVSIMKLLSQKPLRRHMACSYFPDIGLSPAWLFAVTVLRPDFIAERAGLSKLEVQCFSGWYCDWFYCITAELLKKAKTARMGNVRKGWVSLNDNLEIIYCLITYHEVPGPFISQYLEAANQAFVSIIPHTSLLKEAYRVHTREWDAGTPDAVPTANAQKLRKDAYNVLAQFDCLLLNWSEFVKSISREGLDHLQAFVRHRLISLGGHNSYGQVIVNNFHLNTLCRLEHSDEVEDHGHLPPTIYLDIVESFLERTPTTFQSPQSQGNEAPHPAIPKFILELKSVFKKLIDEKGIPCDNQYTRSSIVWLSMTLDCLEDEVTQLEAKKPSDKPKTCDMIPSYAIPDDMPGWTKIDFDPLHEETRALEQLCKP